MRVAITRVSFLINSSSGKNDERQPVQDEEETTDDRFPVAVRRSSLHDAAFGAGRCSVIEWHRDCLMNELMQILIRVARFAVLTVFCMSVLPVHAGLLDSLQPKINATMSDQPRYEKLPSSIHIAQSSVVSIRLNAFLPPNRKPRCCFSRPLLLMTRTSGTSITRRCISCTCRLRRETIGKRCSIWRR